MNDHFENISVVPNSNDWPLLRNVGIIYLVP